MGFPVEDPTGTAVGSQVRGPGSHPVRFRYMGIGVDDPEDRGVGERCLLGFNSGPPFMPSAYNSNMQLIQSPDYVVIVNEMINGARVVPLDGRPHLPEALRQWMGDSRGRWEGDTLVVETTNFTDKTASFNRDEGTAIGTGKTLRLTERFTRSARNLLNYEYTVNDPSTFTRPFTVAIPMAPSEGLFEYACHEGNYGLMNILAGARAQETAAGKTAVSSDPKN
jgi:hypothetical protein